MGRIISIIALISLGIAGGFQLGTWFVKSNEGEALLVPSEPKIEAVLAEGKIKPARGVRLVTTLPGRKVTKILVEPGRKTEAAKTELCLMEDQSLLKMQWELATSNKADLLVEVEQKILSAEINQATAESAVKEARLNQSRLASDSPQSSYVDRKIKSSQKKLVRLKELAKAEQTSAFISTQDVFEQELELEKAKAEKESLKMASDLGVETAMRTLELANRILKNTQALREESKSLELAEAIAEQQYENSKIFSPIDGEVIKIHAFAGDTISSLPIMEIADLSQLIVEADVYFANLPQVQIGQTAKMSSPAISGELLGKVVSKSNYIGSSLLQSPNPLAMADQDTAKIVIEIDPEFTEIARSFLNLQVTVEIDTK